MIREGIPAGLSWGGTDTEDAVLFAVVRGRVLAKDITRCPFYRKDDREVPIRSAREADRLERRGEIIEYGHQGLGRIDFGSVPYGRFLPQENRIELMLPGRLGFRPPSDALIQLLADEFKNTKEVIWFTDSPIYGGEE